MRFQVVIAEPYKSFNEKIQVTKKYCKDKVQIMDNLVYIERWEGDGEITTRHRKSKKKSNIYDNNKGTTLCDWFGAGQVI